MLKKKNLIFLSLLILGVLLLSSCFLKPPVTEGILKGQVMVPEGTVQTKDLTGQALPDATVNIIDLATGDIIATTTTDANGYYQVFVPAGGPYLLQAVKDEVKVQQITCQVEVGIEYDLGIADCMTTAAALIVQAMLNAEDYPNNPADIDCDTIIADPTFDDVSIIVCSTMQTGGDPTTSAAVLQAVEDFLYPPTPTPAPSPSTPTYTVTFNANGGSGTMADQTISSGSSANLTACEFTKTGWGFAGWATTSGGTVVYADEASYTMGSANVTLYARWTINTYTVTYNGNGNTGGVVPSDANNYEPGDSVTVLGNTNLVKTQDGISLLFTGWNIAADGSGTGRIEDDTFDMGSVNIILYAQWSAITATGPAGGLVFYDKGEVSDGWRYLEAAPSDQGESVWSNITSPAVGTSEAIETGQTNTTAIIGQTGHTASAAQLCEDLSITNGSTTYDDWFLPSKGELNLMYTNLHKEGFGYFDDVPYWSSSEDSDSAGLAWIQNFYNSDQDYTWKGNSKGVWAVRAFRSTAPTYIVNYNGNESTSGTVPSDSYHYEPAENVMVLHNTGTLVKTGYTFDGWNTAADGNGTDQAEGSNFTMGASDVTLYAKWLQNFTITFDKNDAGATGSMADQTIASGSSANLMACGFTKTDWTFAGWATTPGGDVEYADQASYTMGIADVTLYAKWTPSDTYSLRDIGPAGGWIFYDDEADGVDDIIGARYLEAAPTDQSTSAEWGCHETEISGADGTAVGTGKQNTIDILNECATSGIAADICADLSLGGYSDWFLPSKDELNLMYENLKVFVIGGFADDYYWSSSEISAYYAWIQNFTNDFQGGSHKDPTYGVRAVRAF